MNGDQMISQLNRKSRPGWERRVDTVTELRMLHTRLKYIFFTFVILSLLILVMNFYTLKHIEYTCSVNSVRYSSILERLDEVKMDLEFIPHNHTTPIIKELNE